MQVRCWQLGPQSLQTWCLGLWAAHGKEAPHLHMPRGGTRPDSLGPLLCVQQQWGPQRDSGGGERLAGERMFSQECLGALQEAGTSGLLEM